MKTKEELNAIKTEFEALSRKLKELTEDELLQICGGAGKDEYYNIILGSTQSYSDDAARNAKIKTGDTRGELTEEQRTPEYIHRQIFGKKYDEIIGN